MNEHVYRWSLRPEEGVSLEVRVTAPSVVVARRVIRRFLVEHDGEAWVVECVSRETSHPSVAFVVPQSGSVRLSH